MQNSKPKYYKPVIPSMQRRMKNIDYGDPGFYMPTIMLSDYIPRLSKVIGRAFKPIDPEKYPTTPQPLIPETDYAFSPNTKISDWGTVVSEELDNLEKKFSCRINSRIIMPDHIHFLIYITEYEPRKLGGIISHFKGRCSRKFWDLNPQFEDKPFWKGKYNDKVVYAENHLGNFYKYIQENPRKYLIRKEYPQYFYERWAFEFNGETYHAIGNIFLLNQPVRMPVRYSSKYPGGYFDKLKEYWKVNSKNGDVIISTFINPEERAVTKECVNLGAKLIWIKPDGFPPRSAVKGDLAYKMAAEGRLLMIAPATYHTQRHNLSRDQCLKLNDLAEYISREDLLDSLSLLR